MPTIFFENDGLRAQVPEGTLLSSAAAEAGASLPFGCRAGTCGTCALWVEQGLATLDPPGFVEDDTLAVIGREGHRARLGCQLIVRSGDLRVSW